MPQSQQSNFDVQTTPQSVLKGFVVSTIFQNEKQKWMIDNRPSVLILTTFLFDMLCSPQLLPMLKY